jgi:hypothetical protein
LHWHELLTQTPFPVQPFGQNNIPWFWQKKSGSGHSTVPLTPIALSNLHASLPGMEWVPVDEHAIFVTESVGDPTFMVKL